MISIVLLSLILLGIIVSFVVLLARLKQTQTERDSVQKLLMEQQKDQAEFRSQFDQHQLKSLTTLQESLSKNMDEVRKQLHSSLTQQSDFLGKHMDKLTNTTGEKLKEISGQVDKKLSEGFEKTNATFTDVVKRLAIIDQAQKRITELSTNVVSLQEVLSDKKARGAFGETQLSALIANVIPDNHYQLQSTLSNGKRVDCLLLLPEPTGNVAIDAKFPLESYRALNEETLTEAERKIKETQFKNDIKNHIQDIHSKYIIPGETSDGAVMFIPAEAIFAQIHTRYPDLVDYAQQQRVWLVSPTTMMAILTTARAVLKDAATRKQVHIIQEHLVALGKDFDRFQSRMDKLAVHIDQAQRDVEDVHKSSRKISSRFNKIEKVEIEIEQDSNTQLPTPNL